MAYSQNFPAQRPVFQFNADAGRVSPNMTFSRADSPIDATKAAASAVHFWSNEKHLSSENLITYSNDVSQSNWVKDGVTETGGQTAPDGGTDAYKLTENTANDEHRIYQAASERITASGSLTVSVYLKYIGRQWAVIRLTDSTGTDRRVWFDIQNGTKGTEETNMTGSITASGNGYYKCVATISSVAASPGTYLMIGGADADNSYVYAGSGSDAFAVWGIQASSAGETVLNETSGQIARSYAPTLKSVATAGAARFEYDPTDGQSAGILIEGQSTNLATYGSDLTNAAWNPLSAFIGGTAVGPDGTLSAVKLVASAGSGLAPRFRRLSLLTDTTQTFSIYVKPLEFQHLAISADGSTSCMVLYNLSGSGAITSATGATGTVEQCGNGWFRLSYSYTTTPSLHLAITMQSSTTYQTETGNGYDGMLFALAMLENSSHASSFIGTTSSTATRALDSLTAVTSDIGYTGGPMTLVTDTTVSDPTSTEFRAAAYVFVDSNNSAGIWATSSDNRIARVETGGIGGNVGTNSGVNGKAALSIDTNDIAVCLNGGSVATDTSHALADFASATLYVGNFGTYANQLNGHIKRVALYNEALSDTNLQALTS